MKMEIHTVINFDLLMWSYSVRLASHWAYNIFIYNIIPALIVILKVQYAFGQFCGIQVRVTDSYLRVPGFDSLWDLKVFEPLSPQCFNSHHR